MTQHYYSCRSPMDEVRAKTSMKEWEEEPDVIQTAQGFAPNYEKFEALGMTTEEALVWCNMD